MARAVRPTIAAKITVIVGLSVLMALLMVAGYAVEATRPPTVRATATLWPYAPPPYPMVSPQDSLQRSRQGQ
jgi:hypothetical protein